MRPDDVDVREGGVTDPFLLPVEYPHVPFATARREHPARSPGTHERFGQPKRADLLPAHHRRQPTLLLLFVPAQIDRACREAGVNAPEGRHGRVDARQLHGHHAVEEPAATGGAISKVTDARDVQSRQLWY